MSQQPIDYGTIAQPPALLARWRIISAAIGLAVGIALTVAMAALYRIDWLARILSPIPLLSLRYNGNNVAESIVFGILQWPLYGLVIGYVWPGRKRTRALVLLTLVGCHALGVIACFRLLP